jgi:hypothetical protein
LFEAIVVIPVHTATLVKVLVDQTTYCKNYKYIERAIARKEAEFSKLPTAFHAFAR